MSLRAWRLTVVSTAALMLVGMPSVAPAQAQPPTVTTTSAIRSNKPVLPHRTRGRAAVRALGENLAPVAARNDLSSARLERLLTEDHTAWLSVQGQLFYQEEAAAEITGGETALATLATAYPTSQTFSLHSHAGAARTIFLDFDGATVADTGWNTGSRPITNGHHIGWDSDGDPTTFSTTEHGWIQEVWREVAESYAPFDVDVTTQDPGAAAYTRTSSSDTTYGTHVLITSSRTAKEQACGTCLGVAWVGTFDSVDTSGYYQPAWVFADDPRFAPMAIAQAASHETGHTLGLHHDGTSTAPYFAGTSSWGPIMGSSRTRAVSQFSLGEYADANNTENDFAVMQANGLPLRPDDHGSTVETADPLGALTTYDARGVISTRADNDVFAISLPCTSTLTLSATGIGAQTALDLSLTVLDVQGRQVATDGPASGWSGSPPVSTGMNAQVSIPHAAGTYYLRVDGVGSGDARSGGWSDYASLGQYRLTATGCPASTQSPPGTPPISPPVTPSPTPHQPLVPTPSGPPTKTANPTANPAATRPGAPVIRVASGGARRRPVTAVARWSAPARTGGVAITSYRVRALRLDARNRVARTFSSAYLQPTARALTLRLPRGRYTFSVMAFNRVGASAWSHSSAVVRAR